MNINEKLQNIIAKLTVKLNAEPIIPEAIVEFMEAVLKDGTLVKYKALAVGEALTVIGVEGEMPAPDATHELENGTLITTVGGIITEVVEATAPDMEAKFSALQKVIENLEAKFLEISTKSDLKFTELKADVLKSVVELSETIKTSAETPAAAAINKSYSKIEGIKFFTQK